MRAFHCHVIVLCDQNVKVMKIHIYSQSRIFIVAHRICLEYYTKITAQYVENLLWKRRIDLQRPLVIIIAVCEYI